MGQTVIVIELTEFMARYVIGDIQGCYQELVDLVQKIGFNPSKDTLYLVGDLVNRGPKSLEVLKWVYKHQDSIVTVLGNHDIYLIGRYAKVLRADDKETIGDVLKDSSAKTLIDYLRSRPLVFCDPNYILVHAGIYPKINFDTVLSLNVEVMDKFKSNKYAEFISQIFGNKPLNWDDDLDALSQMKFIINSCTRMRFLNKNDYSLDYKYKGELANKPSQLVPWFSVDRDESITKKILFGHWAALGFFNGENFIATDTGCVWGRKLTALNLETFDIFQVNRLITD